MTETMRKSAEVMLGPLRFRVVEPAPIRAYRVIQWAEILLAPVLTKILSGQLVDMKRAECPKCGSIDEAINVGDKQWLCKHVVADDGSEHPQACGRMWAQDANKGEDGTASKVTMAYAFTNPKWAAVMAIELQRAAQRLDVDDAEGFMLECLLGATAVVFNDKEHLIRTKEELEQYVTSGAGIKRLLHAAIGGWVLPMLADAYPMPLGSSAAETPGASVAATPPQRLRTGGPPPTSTGR